MRSALCTWVLLSGNVSSRLAGRAQGPALGHALGLSSAWSQPYPTSPVQVGRGPGTAPSQPPGSGKSESRIWAPMENTEILGDKKPQAALEGSCRESHGLYFGSRINGTDGSKGPGNSFPGPI